MKKIIAALVVILIASVFLFFTARYLVVTSKLKAHGVMAEATVTKVVSARKGPVNTVTVRYFTPEGQPTTATASNRHSVKEGDKVRLWYDPQRPSLVTFGDAAGFNLFGASLSSLIILTIIYALIKNARKVRLRKTLMENGTKIAAGQISVGRNEKYRMGDKNPWVIRCKWTDIRNNTEYIFSSSDFTADPSHYLDGRSTVDVYIDPYNPDLYFMDTSFIPEEDITLG